MQIDDQIRKATIDDVDWLYNMYQSPSFKLDIKGFAWSDKKYIELCIKNGNIFCIPEKGTITYYPKIGIEINIETLVVHDDYHRQGIGTALINRVEQEAKTLMIPKILVGSYLKYRANQFYKKLGYTLIGLSSPHTESQAFMFKKNIDNML